MLKWSVFFHGDVDKYNYVQRSPEQLEAWFPTSAQLKVTCTPDPGVMVAVHKLWNGQWGRIQKKNGMEL